MNSIISYQTNPPEKKAITEARLWQIMGKLTVWLVRGCSKLMSNLVIVNPLHPLSRSVTKSFTPLPSPFKFRFFSGAYLGCFWGDFSILDNQIWNLNFSEPVMSHLLKCPSPSNSVTNCHLFCNPLYGLNLIWTAPLT